MAIQERSHPIIPDHDVLRKIGGGSYGEVWLARSVTGAMRAVKVVWREDFADERTFEREFDGLLKYEPISRDHPGLVNVLHVGRSPDETAFYYYVMELGDDITTEQEINPVEYEARTLGSDAGVDKRMPTADCIDVGIALAGALEHLHECGLSHRDVKPSNVIFVNGQAKLADIGLVAASGQRTFVGTEGFVPPEGPGSPQADIYSLGKVLYEIATGQDRLDFPDLPDELPTGAEKAQWLQLNEIICKICEPRKNKRAISSATELGKALKDLKSGTKHFNKRPLVLVTGIICFVIAGALTLPQLSQLDIFSADQVIPREIGLVRVVTTPDGAAVYSEEGNFIELSPTSTGMLQAPVGSTVTYQVRKNGYRTETIKAQITADSVKNPMLLFLDLKNFTPPQEGSVWVDQLGMVYQPVENKHLSSRFVSAEIWHLYLREKNIKPLPGSVATVSEDGQPAQVALANDDEVSAFTEWMRKNAIAEGYLTEDHQIIVEFDQSFRNQQLLSKERMPFHLLIGKYSYGTLAVTTQPPGAEVFIDGMAAGSTETTLNIAGLKPGGTELTFILEGYNPLKIKANVSAGTVSPIVAKLVKNQSVVFGQTWKNSLSMNFAPIGDRLMASIYETRVKDYNQFLAATSHMPPEEPDFEQSGNHPIVSVSRDDAIAFCIWLTEKERAENRLSSTHSYRLPTDAEWSEMIGLTFEIGDGPGEKDANKPRRFPWSGAFPPPEYFANYADRAAVELPGLNTDRFIRGYNDGYSRTSPVGSFQPNENGLYDISGNVQEWVSDDLSIIGGISLGILRGAGWNSYLEENIFMGWRNPVPTDFHAAYHGFRIVIEKEDSKQK